MIKKSLFLLFFFTIPVFAGMKGPGNVVKILGNAGQIALPVTALLSTLYNKDKEGAWQFVKAFSVSIATVWALKPLVHRRRPNGTKWSFPSGHTTSAFAGAAFMQRRYGWSYGIPSYAVAGFVGISRMVASEHWFTDVLAGAAIGIVANYIFTTPYKQYMTVSPYVGSSSVGLAINFN